MKLDVELADSITVCHLNFVIGHHAAQVGAKGKLVLVSDLSAGGGGDDVNAGVRAL